MDAIGRLTIGVSIPVSQSLCCAFYYTILQSITVQDRHFMVTRTLTHDFPLL